MLISKSLRRWASAGVIGLLTAMSGAPCAAGELHGAARLSAAGSSWGADPGGAGSLEFGGRFVSWAGLYGRGQLGYAPVDDRLLTGVSFGAKFWLELDERHALSARLGFLHQHEESLSVVDSDFGSAIFGIGDGIRHRAGAELGLGAQRDLWSEDKLKVFGEIDAFVDLYPDELGPLIYAGGGLSVGVRYAL